MSPPPASTAPRILLGQLFSNGDCLFATVLARQIKQDFPGCHLTWAISRGCRSVLRANPHVDAVWEVEPPPRRADVFNPALDQGLRMWRQFKQEAARRAAQGDFHRVFLTQIGARTLHLYDGTIRSTIYAAYPGPITVPVTPVVRLEPEEVENVNRFVAANPALARCRHRVLFECAPQSGQSGMNPAFALDMATRALGDEPDACFVLSSNVPIASADERIIDGSRLTMRENAELTKHCTLLIGCSSGLSWLATSDWAKPLPTVQLLGSRAIFPNSLARDHRRWGLPTDGILEMLDCPPDRFLACLQTVFKEGFPAAKARFHEELCPAFSYDVVLSELLRKRVYCRALGYVARNLRREGWRARLVYGPARVTLRHGLNAAKRLAGKFLRRPVRPPVPLSR